MKKLLLFLAAAVMTAVSLQARDEISRDPSVLPPAAQALLANNFKSLISFVKIDKDFGRVSSYEAVLTDGTEVKFDRSGNWEEVETRRNGSVPKYFLLQPIRSYIERNHKGLTVVGVDKERGGFDVQLSNGLEIKFDKQGNFKRYDD